MKTGKSIVELAQEIESQRTRKVDFIAPTDKMKAHVWKHGEDAASPIAIEAEIGGEKKYFPMRDLALTQAAAHTGIPVPYVRKMAEQQPELLAHNLNTWFDAKPSRRMVRTLDGNARAFLSDRYQRIDNFDVATVALEAFQDFKGLRVMSTEVTESRMYLKAVWPELTREVKSSRKGDLVEAGVMVCNSEVGLGRVSVKLFANFTVCTNGMVRDGGKAWNHVGRKNDSDDLAYLTDETLRAGDKFDIMVIRDTMKHAFDTVQFENWIEKLQGATEQKVTGRVQAAIEVLSEKLVFNQTEGDSILKHLITGGDLSRYGLINAVTRTAEDAESYDRATEIEALGQRVLDLKPSEWREVAEAA